MNDYIKSKERSHKDSVTACVLLCKFFAGFIVGSTVYYSFKWLVS